MAVVTGAGRGLGREAALALASAGAHVALLGRTASHLTQVAEEICKREGTSAAHPYPADVTDEPAISAIAAKILADRGQIDILINNAGVAKVSPLLKMDVQTLTELLSTNVVGAFVCAKAFGTPMVKRGYGRVINIASISGLVGEPGVSAYAASKGAILAMTRALAAEWAKSGVTVNAVAPGYFRTDLNADALDHPDIGPRILRQIPLGRVGDPGELGPLLVYLASSASAFMTGSTLVIDGGQVAR